MRLIQVRRRAAGLLAASIALVLGACEFNTTAIAPPQAQVVVHAVLNPALAQQVLLLERTLTGTVRVDASRFNPSSPIVSGGGVPITGASVSMTSETGAKWVAAHAGGGVYVFITSQNVRLTPGRRYQLEIRTPLGEVVTGETMIPNVLPTPSSPLRRFNRETDTLHLSWPVVTGARSFALRIDTPTGPFLFFTDSQTIRLPGTLRNLFSEGLPSVFIPGFRQVVTVTAVDRNYFDYYRSRSDGFTGTGQITHLKGGIGFFGAAVNVNMQRLDVEAPFRAPVEGEYELASGSGPQIVRLWIERPAIGGVPALISGRYTSQLQQEPGGIIGTMDGNALFLTMLNGQLMGDTLATFRGVADGDSLIGRVVETNLSVYRKR